MAALIHWRGVTALVILAGLCGGASAAVPWSDYQIIMWQPQTARGYETLESIGITAAAMRINRDAPGRFVSEEFEPLRRANLHWYVENIATDFYSAYHRYNPDRPVNWRFIEIQTLYRRDPTAPAAFIRDPSLSDPFWLAKIRDRLRETVAAHRPHRPLFYNLADEAGIADLNGFWDFDFSSASLAAMREWLRRRYGTLAALNAEWDTHFANWDVVVPETTAAVMKRKDANYAAWSDGKDWMDVAFAQALRFGRDAVHAADPTALAGLEGAQKPGWGGYDYAQLAGAVDVMEADSQTIGLVHALNPRLHLLTTSFVAGPAEQHRIWRALLDGGNGIVLWDAKRQFVNEDGSLGERGRMAAPYFRLLRGGLGALLINSEECPSPTAILYSQASLRIQWLLDWKDKGDAWLGRGADEEDRDDGTVRAAMNAYGRSLEQRGFAPCALSSAMIERGALHRFSYRLLLLPHAIALSAAEAQAIEDFAARGGAVIADSAPGLYDEHGRRLAQPRLAALFRSGRALELAPGVPHHDDAADPPIRLAADDLTRLGAALSRTAITPAIRLRDETGAVPADIAVRTYRDGNVRLLALQRDFPAAAAESVAVDLPHRVYVYDVRAASFLGYERRLHLVLDGVAPAILALSLDPLPRPALALPHASRPGDSVPLRLRLLGASRAAFHVLHVAVSDPAGRIVAAASGNVIMHGGEAEKDLALPKDAAAGRWTVKVVDILSGQRAQAAIEVR